MLINNFNNSISGVTVAYTGSIGSLCCNVIDKKCEMRNKLIQNYKIFSTAYIQKIIQKLIA